MSAAVWSIPIDEIARRVNARVELVVRKVTYEIFKRVIQRSPVDTGRFRANWNVSYALPNYSTTAETGARDAAAAALDFPVGGVVYLTNSLPYARRLEHGWSGQAPQGMVRLTVAEVSQHVRKAMGS